MLWVVIEKFKNGKVNCQAMLVARVFEEVTTQQIY